MEVVNESPAKKPKKLTSVVWNHFERVRKADTCYAVCVHCNKKLSGSSNSGTTHLRNHLMRCLKRSNYDVSQLLSAKTTRKDNTITVANVNYDQVKVKAESIAPLNSYKYDHELKKDEIISLGSMKFDQERSRRDLARMIMLHGYPLAMVDDFGFKIFVKNLQSSFQVITNTSVESDCMAIYEKEKQKVFEAIRNFRGRVSIALSMWNSPENVEYLCLTANYVDEDWQLRKKTLSFITLDSSHTDDSLSEVVIKCLMNWEVERKLFSMTFDEVFTYDDVAFRVKDWLSQNKPLLKNGELFDVRCAQHVLKSIVQEVLEALEDVNNKIRESIRYVNCSQATQGKFYEIVQQVGINYGKRLSLDCPNQWKSTHLMLEATLEYRGALSILQEHDPAYTTNLSEEEWEWVSSVTGYLKLLVEVTDVFSGSKHSTANIFFSEMCDVHIQLIEWCKSPNDFISFMAVKMKTKFDKYWSKCSFILAIAAVLDPRFKMKVVEYYYPQIYGNDAPDHVKEVADGIMELFNEYSVGLTSHDQELACPSGSISSTGNGARERLKGFDKFLHETSGSNTILSDLEKYLGEPVFPRNSDFFNILNWWKVHTPQYPILSMMARDIVCIPFCTLAQELAFSTGGRVLGHHLSSLNAHTREALICGQEWMHMESEDTNSSSSHLALQVVVDSS